MSYLDNLKEATNFGLTENGGIKHLTTNSGLMDLFGMGGAYRKRSDDDVILLFKKAFDEEPEDAIRCLFYLRDCREGQGERRFFRVILSYLAKYEPKIAKQLIHWVPFYARWDDLYAMVEGNPDVAMYVWRFIQDQLKLDLKCETPSLLAKWLKSENATSYKTKRLATATRSALELSSKQYRQTLSYLREKINIVERLMSENRWDEIEFDKIPSAAGLRYRNAFARHDIIKEKYKQFAQSADTKVNAGTLYPYEVVAQAFKLAVQERYSYSRYEAATKDLKNTERLMINKYWDNLTDYFKGSTLDALCVVDTSGSMWGDEASAPINVAISLGLYAAERARGPFAHHYISFSSRPQLIETEGVDFVDKVFRIYRTNLCENTNIEATFDLLLDTAIKNHCKQEELPKSIVIISDMEFDYCTYSYTHRSKVNETVMEAICRKWNDAGYEMPNLVFWNVESRSRNNIPMKVKNGVTLVSGFSPVIFQQLMSGKTAYDLMYDTLHQERYMQIKVEL